jgi:alpha-L-rhamnosidase
METAFRSAKPVWAEGREREKNLTLGFHTRVSAPASGTVLLRATGSSIYRVFLNGEFFGYGPARGPHGWYRVDEWDLTPKLKPGANDIAFEVAGYNVNSYYLLDQPAFLQAEVVCEGQVLASTAGTGTQFSACVPAGRLQKVQRYSFQRPFSEMYRLQSGWDGWRTGDASGGRVSAKSLEEKQLLPRRVPMPEFSCRAPSTIAGSGTIMKGAMPAQPWKDRSLTTIGPKLGGYPENELEGIPSLELQAFKSTVAKEGKPTPWEPTVVMNLKPNAFQIVDFGCNLTGFIGQRVKCSTKTRLVVTFDEILSEGDVDFKRLGCVNIIAYELEPGTYAMESFEPYTFRYLKFAVLEGECEVSSAYLREYVNPDVWKGSFAASDVRLNRLFAAGRETYRQNALDAFMDCPSRERAGWLCDSYFTARVALDLSGNTTMERTFFENYMLPKQFEFLPEGMLPMCYPADHNDGVFIPNWSLWFVVELEEYLARSGDKETVRQLQPRLEALFRYFEKFRNNDGLLEKLSSWVFVEWSAANSFVQDVNYPSNMLFARALISAGRLCNRPEWIQDGERVLETVRKQSFDGRFFVDNAVRRDGKLVVTTNRTEVCQYFAFYFGAATPETHPALWKTLQTEFGPSRKQTKAHPDVPPANAFIGNVLRLELLSRAGLTQQLLDESLAYQLYMVDRTGTLWENDGAYASCNHGFASHGGVHVLYRDVLGLRAVDTVNKRVDVRFADTGLEWCQGSMPTPDGLVSLSWQKDGEQLNYTISVPSGYAIDIKNLTKRELVRK